MKMRVLLFFAIIASFSTVANAANIPDFFKICSRDDPELNQCLKESIRIVVPALAAGYKNGGINVPSIDPYIEKELKIEYKRNQIFGRAFLKNIKVTGLANAKIHDVRANIQDDFMEIEVDMSNDEVLIDGFFRGEGRLNAITFNTKGFYNSTMSDLVWTWKISGTTEKKNNATYMKIKRFFMRPEVGNMSVTLPVIFKDNPELDRIAVNFANTYWKLIYNELLPVVEQSWNRVGTRICNKIFSKIPYDELFPLDL